MILTELDVSVFIDHVASDSPAPGGGSVAALAAANGIALLGMVARLTVGKKKYAAHDELMNEIITEADKLRQKLVALIDSDTEAFKKVSAVFSMPKESDEQKSARQQAMQQALKSAAEVPMEVMENCLIALKITHNALGKSNTNAASDLGVAALMLGAGLKGAWLNVKINLSGIKDAQYTDEMAKKGEKILCGADNLSTKIYDCVLEEL